MEKAIELPPELGVRLVLCRIGVAIGKGEGGMLPWMKPIFEWGLGGYLGSGNQYVPWIHVDDVV